VNEARKGAVYCVSGDHFPQPIYGDVTVTETAVIVKNARSGWPGGVDAWGEPGAFIPRKTDPRGPQGVWAREIVYDDGERVSVGV
jgi:hypothetical protein